MHVTMLQSRWVTLNGRDLRFLRKDQTYQLPENLACQLLASQMAVSAIEKESA